MAVPDLTALLTWRMDTNLVGQTARLPDGQTVKIETVHDDGLATVRRIEGEWKGEVAVCELSKLKILTKPTGKPLTCVHQVL